MCIFLVRFSVYSSLACASPHIFLPCSDSFQFHASRLLRLFICLFDISNVLTISLNLQTPAYHSSTPSFPVQTLHIYSNRLAFFFYLFRMFSIYISGTFLFVFIPRLSLFSHLRFLFYFLPVLSQSTLIFFSFFFSSNVPTILIIFVHISSTFLFVVVPCPSLSSHLRFLFSFFPVFSPSTLVRASNISFFFSERRCVTSIPVL